LVFTLIDGNLLLAEPVARPYKHITSGIRDDRHRIIRAFESHHDDLIRKPNTCKAG